MTSRVMTTRNTQLSDGRDVSRLSPIKASRGSKEDLSDNKTRGSSMDCRPFMRTLLALCLLLLSATKTTFAYVDGDDSTTPSALHFFNEWVVKLRGGPENADRLARDLDYVNLGQVGNFADVYLMQKRNHPRRSRRHASHLTKRLTDDFRVEWAEQQYAKRRVKRDLLELTDTTFDDPLWPHQWYLKDTRSQQDSLLPRLDLNVQWAWKEGFTGQGVVVTIVDDGLEWNHTDILPNYDPGASLDLNGNDNDPFPTYDSANSNRHGTRCAGEVSMVANNDKCGVGVAFDSKIGGIRLLDGPVTDMTEAQALSHNISHVDVFSASWGPTDDGCTVEGPGRLALEAFKKGISEGRGGKGVIYVWAAGNGGSKGDNCNCDGYTGSIYTLSVGSASQHGKFPWYGEMCASTIASTYSSGAYSDQRICSTDLHNECTIDHTGTSAAAPLAAGIVALALQANPELTWRDVQHLVVWTSEVSPLLHNPGWSKNAAGLRFNSRFGFGLLNAAALVSAARNWKTVPQSATCQPPPANELPRDVSTGNQMVVTLVSDNCNGTMNEVNYVEHVEVLVDIAYSRRGALEIYLESPKGSRTALLFARSKDASAAGFKQWRFMSVHTWGENPLGQWKLTITDQTTENNSGSVKMAALLLHGTRTQPAHMSHGERSYDVDNELEAEDLMGEEGLNDVSQRALDWSDLVGNRRELRRLASSWRR